MNSNFATSQDRAENYLAGEALKAESAREAKKAKVNRSFSFSGMWARARKLHSGNIQNPIVPNMADYVNWFLYDRAVFAAAASIPTNSKLFTVPIGTAGKTKSDTNLEQVSQLMNPHWMNVTHLGFYFNPNVLDIDINALFDQSYFEFWVNSKVYAEGKLNMFPAGGGIAGFSTKTTQSAMTNGFPQPSNMIDLRIPGGTNLGSMVADGLTGINILQQQTFKIELNLPGGALVLTANNAVPNPGNGLTLACYLYGILSRSVQ